MRSAKNATKFSIRGGAGDQGPSSYNRAQEIDVSDEEPKEAPKEEPEPEVQEEDGAALGEATAPEPKPEPTLISKIGSGIASVKWWQWGLGLVAIGTGAYLLMSDDDDDDGPDDGPAVDQSLVDEIASEIAARKTASANSDADEDGFEYEGDIEDLRSDDETEPEEDDAPEVSDEEFGDGE